jgi:hypothetical protein
MLTHPCAYCVQARDPQLPEGSSGAFSIFQ